MKQHMCDFSQVPRAMFAVAVVSVGLSSSVARHARADEQGPYFATGIKIGEVTDHSAIVWTRLTRHAERNPADGPMVRIEYDPADKRQRRERAVKGIFFPDGKTVADLREGRPARMATSASVGRPTARTTGSRRSGCGCDRCAILPVR